MKLVYGEVINESWQAIRKDLALVAGLTAVLFFGVWVLNLIPFVNFIFMAPLSLGYLKCLNEIRKGQTIGYQDFFWGFLDFNRFLHVVLMSVLVYVGTIIGVVLLVVPGVWFAVSTAFTQPIFFLQPKEDAIEAIKKSMDTVKGRWWNIFGFLIVIALLNLAGALCLLIGLLVTAPISSLAFLIAFEKLSAVTQLPPDDLQNQNANVDPSRVTVLP